MNYLAISRLFFSRKCLSENKRKIISFIPFPSSVSAHQAFLPISKVLRRPFYSWARRSPTPSTRSPSPLRGPATKVCPCPFISFAGRSCFAGRSPPSPTQARTSPDPSPPAEPIWPWRAPPGLGAIGVRAQETCAAPYKARRPRPPPVHRRRPACAQCEAPRRLLPEPPSAPPPHLKTNRRRRPPIPTGPVVLRPR
jgi:hypothetical protein